MKTIVIGAGVIGVTTAYELAADGHEVVVLERAAGAGLETSYANGGQISPSEAAPWPGPEVPWQALRWLGRPGAPFRWKPSTDPDEWRWLLRFLARCRSGARLEGLRRSLSIAAYSRERLAGLRQRLAEEGLDYDARTDGILRIYREAGDMERSLPQIPLLRELGEEVRAVDAAGCAEIEPALEAAVSAGRIVGGIYAPHDESGDAYRFTTALADIAARAGVTFHFGVTVSGWRRESGRVRGVETDLGAFEADAVVLAAGTATPALLKPLGLRLSVYPVKGYSVTLDVAGANQVPSVSLTDEGRRMVMSRLGDRLRAAGMAEVAGFDRTIEPARADALLDGVLNLFPNAGDRSSAQFWTGLRPMTPDGPPILGRAPGLENLYLNTGHGSLGWTMACGSARLVADLVSGQPPALDFRQFLPR